MISITPTLEAAAGAASRSSLCRVQAESISLEPTAIITNNQIHITFQKSSSGYWFATHGVYNHFYYRKQTAPCTAADWPALLGSWTQGDTPTTTIAGTRHDVCVDGDTIIMAYISSTDIRIRRSTDAAASWNNHAAAVSAYIATPRQVVCPNVSTVYVYGSNAYYGSAYGMARIDWNGVNWSVTSLSSVNARLPFEQADFSIAPYLMFGRDIGDYDALLGHFYVIADGGYFVSASDLNSYIQGRILCGIDTPNFSTVEKSFGNISGDPNFIMRVLGCSRETNGYFYTLVEEIYGARAEAGSFTSGNQYYIGKTNDFIYFHLMPIDLPSNAYYCSGIAICEDEDYMVIPIQHSGSSATIYKVPCSSFFGYSQNETDITTDVVNNVAISQSLDAAAKATITLNNYYGRYDDDDDVKAASIVRVDTGYTTPAGNEYQQRFQGKITGSKMQLGSPDTITVDAMDSLFEAGLSAGKPHIIQGPNVFFTSFDDENDLDFFVPQGGNWYVDTGTGRMIDSSRDTENISFLGLEPSMNHTVIAAIRWRPFLGIAGASEQSVGIAFGGSSEYPDRTYVFRLINGDRLQYGYINMWASSPTFQVLDSKFYSIQPAASGFTSHTFWFMAINRCGYFELYTSTNGSTWTLQFSKAATAPYPVVGYVGIYSYCDGTFTPPGANYHNKLSQILYHSHEQPYTGSNIMKFMGTLSGMEDNEIVEIEDGFAGAAFSSRWNTPGTDGTWTVSGGMAHGAQAAADPTILRTDFSAEDVVVQCDVEVSSDLSGIFVRGNASLTECYAGMVDTSSARILKKSAGVWETLYNIPITLSDTVRLKLRCFKEYIGLYVDDLLIACVYDEDLTSGYVGMASDGATSDHDNFFIHGFYLPIEVVVLRPTDKPIALMQQISEMYDNGHFFCDQNGELVWGVFDDTEVDIDLSPELGRVLTKGVDVATDQILTAVRVEGKNAYAEARDEDWAMALGSNRHSSIQNASAQSAAACYSHAESVLEDSKRVRREMAVMKGHPGLQPGDIIQTRIREGSTPRSMLILSFNELIGTAYEQTINEMIPLDAETP